MPELTICEEKFTDLVKENLSGVAFTTMPGDMGHVVMNKGIIV